ncbi:Clp protease N-terminal domain-containing protein [Nonomuraea longicatena]|uniref:Clp R domain-containing protein n=1 Tax=Nonomuraea longicatena TaxID=83682 RepID=A0ABN1NMG2_9ACTN
MSAIDHYLNAITQRAESEALDDGSAAVEAHHLLLALAAHEGTAAHRTLTREGLDRRAVRDALDREFEDTLSKIGVEPAHYDLTSTRGTRTPKLSASARLAFERGFAASAGKKDLRPAHILLGVLEAEVGTVPRALALAGVDRVALTALARDTLDGESW